jgi:hypothetical protein
MAWIESHQELARHPKTKRLARAAGIQIPAAIGHLHLLWWWALDYAQSGELTGFTHGDIADAALWEGDPETFAGALAEAGFIDREGERIFVHDWPDYAGKLVERRAKDRERKRASAAVPQEPRRNLGGSGADSIRTVPDPTVPDLTVPGQKDQGQLPAAGGERERAQNETGPGGGAPPPAHAPDGIGADAAVPYQKIIRLYNAACKRLPKIKFIQGQRRRATAARFKRHGLEGLETAFRLASESEFLNGGNSRGWRADFDWLMNPTNIAKVLEGKYSPDIDGPPRDGHGPEPEFLKGFANALDRHRDKRGEEAGGIDDS